MNFKTILFSIFSVFTLYSCNSQLNDNEDNIKSPLIYKDHYRELIEASEKEDTLLMKEIINKYKLNPNYLETKNCISLLNWCIVNNKIKSTEELLRLGANPNMQDSFCNYPPPIIIASKSFDTSYILPILLKFGGDVNLKSYNFKKGESGLGDKSPLYAAIYSNYFERVKMLVEKGADVNLKIDSTPSPLAVALLYRKLEIIKFLIDNGADFKELNFVTMDGEKLTIYDFLDKIHPIKESKEIKLKKQIIDYLESKNYKR